MKPTATLYCVGRSLAIGLHSRSVVTIPSVCFLLLKFLVCECVCDEIFLLFSSFLSYKQFSTVARYTFRPLVLTTDLSPLVLTHQRHPLSTCMSVSEIRLQRGVQVLCVCCDKFSRVYF